MAIELMARILAQPRDHLDSSEKLVLLVMADRADDDGFLWYAISTIADKASFTRRATQKIMARLIQRGLVKKQSRRDRSNFYVIQVDRFPAVERKRKLKETGPATYIDGMEEAEPDLFAAGEPGSPAGERRSTAGEPGSGTGERRPPNSLSDPSIDSPQPNAPEGAEGESMEEMVARLWNELAERHEPLAPVRGKLSDDRKRKIELRTEEGILSGAWIDVGTPEQLWRRIMETIGRSKLLTGQKIDWAPTLDWVLGPKNFRKIVEGNYGHGHDAIGSAPVGPAGRSAVAAGTKARELVERARNRGRPDAGRPERHSRGAAGAHH